jgi:hypothetical protein
MMAEENNGVFSVIMAEHDQRPHLYSLFICACYFLRLNTHCVNACWLKESNKEDEQSAPPSVCSFLSLS